MSEKKQVPKMGENPIEAANTKTLGDIEAERGYERTHYHDIADRFIRDHAGNVPAEDRDFLVNSVAAEVRTVFERADSLLLESDSEEDVKQYKVKELESLIRKLRNNTAPVSPEAQSQQEPAADNTPTEVIPAQSSEASSTESESSTNERPVPADANEHDYDELESQTNQDKRRNFIMRGLIAANLWTGSKVLNGYSRLAERRNKSAEKYKQQEGESDEAYEKRVRKTGLRWNMAGVAIGSAFLGYAAHRWMGVDLGDVNPFDNDSQNGSASNAQQANADPNKGPEGSVTRRAADEQALQEMRLASYNNSDSSFYDFANKQFPGDHGTPLVGSEADGNKGFGFADWMGRNKHEPNGLANLVSGLGLDGKGDSFKERNEFADYLNGSVEEQKRYDEMVQSALNDPKRFNVETVALDQYTTTLMVDQNGDPVIAQKSGVRLGGNAFKITNAETGEVTYWRKECGGYQQVWPEEVVEPVYQEQGGGYYEQQPVYGGGQGGGGYEGGEGGGDTPTPQPEQPTPRPEQPTPQPESPTPQPESPTPQPEKDTTRTPDQPGWTPDTTATPQTQHQSEGGDGTTTNQNADTTTEQGETTTEDTGDGVGAEGADEQDTDTSAGTETDGAGDSDDNTGTVNY